MSTTKEIKPIPHSTQILKGVGKQIAKQLARLDIHSVPDLLFHLPIRYQDRTRIEMIARLKPGMHAVIEGVIKQITKPPQSRTKLLCEINDGTGSIYLRLFHVLSYQSDVIKVGNRLRCFNEVRFGQRGFEMIHPEFQLMTEGKQVEVEQHLTPIYPATDGISQYMLRKLTTSALEWLERESTTLVELLPETLLRSFSFPTLKEALKFVHRPPNDVPLIHLEEMKTLAQKRLVFEELLAHRISLLQVKKSFQAQAALPLITQEKLAGAFLSRLPFKLTSAQFRVCQEIKTDLSAPHPMLRLVQGDVGSGKTVVAALAMLQAVENGFQAAMMAPTELLAEQHYRVFKRWLEPLGLNVLLLAGNLTGKERKAAFKQIEEGSAQIILGTHALFQEEVKFSRLALIIVDEQHRFGVHQRALLREKGKYGNFYPHQLILTATPIPRTLAMSYYADLDCSTIDELPPGRTPIATSVIPNTKRDEVISRIREACQLGRQAYWVCPLIEESEMVDCQSAINIAEVLQLALPTLKIGLIHGRMLSEEKEKVMQAFAKGEIHLLVATTVIEVGVDVANASLMIIENAERLGLSQLHQLRGRVGRGSVASHCVLLYQSPLSDLAKERLQVMRETTDGFKIAKRDLELRGPGEVLGTRQAGELSFRVADLLRDNDLLPQIQQAADEMLIHHQDKIPILIDRWLGSKGQYGKV